MQTDLFAPVTNKIFNMGIKKDLLKINILEYNKSNEEEREKS